MSNTLTFTEEDAYNFINDFVDEFAQEGEFLDWDEHEHKAWISLYFKYKKPTLNEIKKND